MENSENEGNLPAPVFGWRGAWFLLLWLVWAALLGGATYAGNLGTDDASKASLWLRMGSSLVLVLTGCLSCVFWGNSAIGGAVRWLAIGMALGAVGDFFMAGLLKFIPLPYPVLGGMAAFGLGHLAYLSGCAVISRRTGLKNARVMTGALLAWQLIALAAWFLIVMQGTKARGLVWPSLPYSALLAGTAGMTSGLAWQNRRFLWLALGGALFLASDLLLAFGMFRGRLPHQSDLVWLTYGPGQMLIVFSALSAVQVMRKND